ncbi:MAG: amino acid adenylation domain-containing protein [Prevotellaceae bacterium]|nr:amino acid adenylation domain-containing protein [Prevotellaceae bacterium]
MTKIEQNIANLYDTLIADGYFRDDNNEINLSVEQFGDNLSKEKIARVFYSNLLADGYFRDGEDILLTEEDFLTMVGARKEKREFYPLAGNQLGIYFDWEMNPETTQYNIPMIRKYAKKSLGSNSNDFGRRLQEAVNKAVNTFAVLKTTFGMKDDEVVQYPHEDAQIEAGYATLDFEPDNEYFQKKVRPFNLKEDSLCRAEVIETPESVYLFIDVHHIVFDGVSGIILDEAIARAYMGGEVESEMLSSYDYALEEEELRNGEAYQEAEKWFDDLVKGVESIAYPHSSVLDKNLENSNAELHKTIDGQGIDAFCDKRGVSENSFYMSAFMQVLHRVTREDSLVITTINNGRSRAELMGTIGMFVKTVPIVSTLPEGKASGIVVEEYAEGLEKQYLGAVQRGFYPFAEVVKRNGLKADIMYVFQDAAGAESLANDSEEGRLANYEQVEVSLDTAKVPLKMSVITHAGGKKTFEINYDATLYSEADMQQLLDMVIAASISLCEAKTLADISILPAEQKEVVASFRQTAQADVPLKLHHQPIEKNAVEMPDAVALIAKDCTLTFRQFNEEANRIAWALMERGVKRGDRVVLLLPRTSAVIVSMFGVSKTGAAYIPCDPAYPTDRISLIMTDSEAQYVITTKDYIANYDADKVIDIDDIYKNEKYSTANPEVEISPEDLAYLIYTSGSTGRPKGVMLRHVGITNYLYNHPANVHIAGLKRLGVKTYVSITTLSFDMSLKEFAGSLYNGITTVLADEQEVIDPILLAKLMNETGAEAINGTCSRIQSYLELPEFCDAISRCKMVWSGGEMYPQSLLEKLQSLGVEIINTYGPTEITVSSNIANLTNAKRVTVGRPLLNYVEYIVDKFDREVPIGIAGELLIGGPGVARGYNNLPEMTAERFVEYNGVRVYRSGDLARWTADGEVEILGRIDNQVKINGFRVELGEIETQAETIEGIQKAIAVVKKISGMDHLILYYTVADGAAITAEKIEEALRGTSLAEYMIPDIYMQIDEVPLTPNGKTNVKALPEPQMKAEEIVMPRNEQEQKMWNLIAEMLGTKEFGVETNLVSVGLSSIAAIRLSAIFARNDIQLSTRDIMKHPVISQLVKTAYGIVVAEENPLQPHEMREWYPMSETQKGMYFDCIVHPDAIMYNIPSVSTFVDVDSNRLINAVKEVFYAHPYLNCRLKEHDGEVMQHRDDTLEPIITEVTLDTRPDEAFFQSQVRPFDLMNDPLYRFTIFHYKNETSLLIDIHHLISDGTSNQVLAFELKKAFEGKPLEKEVYTAYDRAIDEKELIESERGKEAETYFDTLLDGVETTDYPHSSTLDEGKRYDTISTDIVSAEINKYCKENLLLPSSFFMSVFHAVLHRLTREDKTLIHFISNGRAELKLDNFFGVFVKTLPSVCTDFKRPMAEIVKDIDTQMRNTIDNDFYPFEEMVARHDIGVNIVYNYFVDLETDIVLDNQAGNYGNLNWDTAKNPLSITILSNDKGEYQSFLEYDATIYNRKDMETLSMAFKTFAENCVKGNVATAVPLISASEAERIIRQSQGDELVYDKNDTFVSLFLAQAERRKDVVAVSDGKSSYTYGELDALSNALAKKLLDTVGENTGQHPFMSIMLGYEINFLVAALAVERAGYAYVPLDYDYPNDRLLYMLEDSESQVLITSHNIYNEKTSQGDDFTAKNIIFIDDLKTETKNLKPETLNLATPDGLAYMIYTSGSTGKPKGVMIPHRAKTSFIHFIAKLFHHTENSRICCHSSFSFDASVEDLYPVLTVGGTLYVVPQEARKDIDVLHSFIIDNGITGGGYSTQFGMLLLQQYPDMELDYFNVGGEKMTMNLPCKCDLYNSYGPTEFTVDATIYKLEPNREYSNIPIGRPLDNTAAYVVDKYGNLMPDGVAGELCMAGIQMAAGYWNRQDLTEEKFNTLLIGGKNVKVYHTGDLVRYNEEGQLEYLGRIDSQVKLRGFRIELGEIESQIASYGGVQLVKVLVKTVNGVQHLVAYYSADTNIDTASLDEHLSAQLTDYMVPDVYMQLDEMPLTPNGKVNTKALPEPVIEQTEYVEPVGEKEIAVAECISQVLNTDSKVGAMDNFFSLGGDSIKSIRLVSMLRQKGIQLTVADVMKHKTVKAIAASAEIGAESNIAQETVTGEILPGAIQRYFFNMNLPHAEHFNQSVAIESATPINIDALCKSLDAVAIHHDMLRMRAEDGKIFINDTDHTLYNFAELTISSKDEITEHAGKMHAAIDLRHGPVMKVGVYHLPASDVLVLICHHMAVDGVSWRVITEDLILAYNQLIAGKEVSLPKKTHSFKYYTEAIQRYRDSYKLSLEKPYWENVQRKMTTLPQGGGSAEHFSRFNIQYSNDCLSHLLTDAHDAYNTTENDLLIAAFLRSYRNVTGNDSASLMMEGHGREPIHEPLVTDRTVGWFTSMYPVVVEGLNGDVRHDVRLVKETFRAVPNKGLGYGILQYIPSLDDDTNLRTDLTECLGFNYLGDVKSADTMGDFKIADAVDTGLSVNTEGETGVTYMINCTIIEGVFDINVDYDTKVYTPQQARAIADGFCRQLEEIVSHTLSVKATEPTASDLGAIGWTDAQYESISRQYADRGETIQRIYPLTPMQEGILLEYMNDPKTSAYVLINRYELSILPTEQQVRYALDVIAAKHEVFRTSIIYRGVDAPCQAIIDRKLGLRYIDISYEGDILATSERIHREELAASFDLQSSPLYRVVVLKTSDTSCHILLITHHIIIDGWCQPIYFQDFLGALLDAMAGNEHPIVAAASGRYEEAVRNLLAFDKKSSLAYWKELMADYTDKAIIPYSYKPETEAVRIARSLTLDIDSDTMQQLHDICSRHQITLNTIMEYVWGTTLHIFNNNSDAIFGKVVSGRNHGDVADLVGLFINTIPVRVRTEDNTTVLSALQSLQQQAADSAAHDYCSLAEIQQQSSLRSNLLQSTLIFENYAGKDTVNAIGEKMNIRPLQNDEEIFNELRLVIALDDANMSMSINMMYDGNLYSDRRMQTVMQTMQHLLTSLPSAIDSKVAETSLMSEADKAEVIRLSKGKDMPFDYSKTYLDYFIAKAHEVPDNLAVDDDTRQLTYAELEHRSNLLAHKLIEKGAHKQSFIGVMIERSIDFPTSVFAIHKAAAAYLPLDLEYPVERLAYMLENSEAPILITTHDVFDTKRGTAGFDMLQTMLDNGKILFLDEIDWTEDYKPINLCTPDCYTYIIYTSGSTGKPKGVVLHHLGLMSYILSTTEELQLTPSDRISSHRSFSFDSHIEDLYPILLLGGSLHIMPSSIRKDLQAVYDFVVRHNITGGGYTTSIAALIANNFELPVRYISAIGEKLTGVISRKAQILNFYGPTECTDHISVFPMEENKEYADIPIGHVVANSWCFIVDNHGRLVPYGAIGELCIAGIQVGVGYWHLPEQTAKVYGDCPFVDKNINGTPVRLYHTGDLARYDDNGQLLCLGRIDGQVKVRGYRIELGEIESVAMATQGINEVVAAVKKVNGTAMIALYYTVVDAATTDTDIMKVVEASALPDYMYPSAYMKLDEMPRLPNGKINRRALPEPEIAADEYIAPSNDIERRLAEGLEEMLKVERISVQSNLLSLGLTSLLAMRLSMAITQGHNVRVTVADIMKAPTIRQIANLVERSAEKTAAPKTNALFNKRSETPQPSGAPKANPLAAKPNPLAPKANPLKKNPLSK